MVMRDVACAGYVAGGNVRFFAEDHDGNFTTDACNANLMSRLAFDDDVTDKYASMLAFPAMEGQFKGGQLDTCMSVTTRLLPWEVSNTSTHDSFPGGDEMFNAYQNVLNLKQIHYGEDMKAAENQVGPPRLLRCTHARTHTRSLCAQDFISQGSTNNSTCFLGPHRKYDPFTKTFMSLTPGQGHVRTRPRPARLARRCSPLLAPRVRSLVPTRFRETHAGVAERASRSRRRGMR